MRILVIGGKGDEAVAKKATVIVTGLTMAGHPVGHAQNESAAERWVRENTFDLAIIVDCVRLEQTDLDAEQLKHAHKKDFQRDPLRVFALWHGVDGFERGSEYGLASIDMLLVDTSAKRCMQAYEALQSDAPA